MISQRAIEAIEFSDTDELIRVIDGYCEDSAWEQLLELRSRCREAVARGKQVWGVEELIRYRLALEAPPETSGPIVSEGSVRFALGPLAEVAASTKTWEEMESYLGQGPERLTFLAERVIRGDSPTEEPIDLPGSLMSWEPWYEVATYRADKLEAPSPSPPATTATILPDESMRLDDIESESALADLVAPWAEQSNGKCQTAAVSGNALSAIRALGLSNARVAEVTLTEACAWMGWAGASGGAHGRRRGAAAGRFGVWWVLATLLDFDWPVEPDELSTQASRLRWFRFDDDSPGTGWQLRLAVEDVEDGLAWAISAVDSAD